MTVKAAAQGFQVSEVPSVWTNRQTGQSHFGMMKELNHGEGYQCIVGPGQSLACLPHVCPQ